MNPLQKLKNKFNFLLHLKLKSMNEPTEGLQDHFNNTKKNAPQLYKDTLAKVVRWEWCKGYYATNAYPWLWSDTDMYNKAEKEFLSAPPLNPAGLKKYGFDKDGRIVIMYEYDRDACVFDVNEKLPSEWAPIFVYDPESDQYIDAEFKNNKFYSKSPTSPSFTVELNNITRWMEKYNKRDYLVLWVVTGYTSDGVTSFSGRLELDGITFKAFDSYSEIFLGKGIPKCVYDINQEKKYYKVTYDFSPEGKLLKANFTEEKFPVQKSVDDMLKEIEKKYKVKLPDNFKQLYLQKDNLPDKSKNYFNNPVALLCCNGNDGEVEWYSADKILDWKAPDYWNPAHKILPVAGNGCGDEWSFYLNWTESGKIPLILAYHDEDRAEAYAPDFESFLMKQMLEAFLEIDSGIFKYRECDSTEQYRKSLIANVKTVKPYLKKEWAAYLDELVNRPFNLKEGYDIETYELISKEEFDKFIRDLNFSHAKESFKHMI
jgi:hypothetical protein